MTREQILLAMIPLAYLVGSIPFGLLVGKAKGIDPRTSGSGNIGATNLGRLLGGKYFALVFGLDLLKSAVPTFAAGAVIGFEVPDRQTCLLWIAVGAASLLGHVFSVFLKFKGGKGVATSAGVMLGNFSHFSLALIPGVLVFIISFRMMRYVSVSSILAALTFSTAYIIIGIGDRWPLLGAQLPLLCFAILLPILIIYKHRANLARLRGHGTTFCFKSIMRIKVNGQENELPEGADIHALLAAHKLTPDKVAVELNRRLVRSDKYNIPLKPGDQVEIVTFVGGG